MKHKWMKRTGMVLLIVVLAAAAGFVWYVSDVYPAQPAALEAMQGNRTVAVTKTGDAWLFDGPGTEDALIFYPGAKVEPEAYAPLLLDLSEKGIDCFLVQMPFDLAIFGKDRAQTILDAFDYPDWYVGGHSLGGAMAADFAASHLNELDGLVLLAAYPTKPLDKDGFKVISIYGSEDGVLNRQKLEETREDLPADAQIVELPGGNHAGFGEYGKQDGDGDASLSGAGQQNLTADLIVGMME